MSTENLKTLLQFYAYSNDQAVLQERLPNLLSVLSGSLHSNTTESASSLSSLVARITELLKLREKDSSFKIMAALLISHTIPKAKKFCFSFFSQWAEILNFTLLSSTQADELKILVDALNSIYICCVDRLDLSRDVVNAHLGVSVHHLLKKIEDNTDDSMVTLCLPPITRWINYYPSLVKPYAEKIEKVVIPKLFTCNESTFSAISAYLVQACNCSGKQGCSEKYTQLSRKILGSLDGVFDILFSSVDENQFRPIEWNTFALPDYEKDYVIRIPQLLSCAKRLSSFLAKTFSGPLLSAAPVPISEIMDLMKRAFDITSGSSRNLLAEKEEFLLVTEYFAPLIHQYLMEMLAQLVELAGTRMVRYSTCLSRFIQTFVFLYSNDKGPIKASIYKLVQALISVGITSFLKSAQKEFVHMACSDFIFQKPNLLTKISQVEQLGSSSKKTKTQKPAVEKFSSESQAFVPNLAMASLDTLAALFKRSHYSLTENSRLFIDQCLSFNLMLAYTCHSQPRNQLYDAETVLKCKSVMVESVAHSGYEQSSLIPLAMTIATLTNDSFMKDRLLQFVRPSAPFIPRRSLKRSAEAVEEYEDEELKEEVREEQTVEEEIREENTPFKIELVPPTEEEKVSKYNIDTAKNEKYQSANEPECDFDLAEFEIVDAEPDE